MGYFANRLKKRLETMTDEEFEQKMQEMEESCNIGPEASEFIKMQEDYIKQQDEIEADKLFLDLNSALVKFWVEKGRPSKGVKIAALERMLNWYKKMGTVVLQDVDEEEPVDFEKLALEKYPETMTYDSRGLYDRRKYDRDIYKQGLKDGYNLKHKIRNDNNNL